jgi:hypothetical protein
VLLIVKVFAVGTVLQQSLKRRPPEKLLAVRMKINAAKIIAKRSGKKSFVGFGLF